MHEYRSHKHNQHLYDHPKNVTIFQIDNRTLETQLQIIIHTDYCPQCMLHIIEALYEPKTRNLFSPEGTP